MKIPTKIFRLWCEKHSRGDVARLVNFTKASKPTIIKALRHGQASEENILKISEYYSEKKMATEKEIETQALKMLTDGTTKNY